MSAGSVHRDLRTAPPALLAEVLALNAFHETETSPLTADELADLLRQAFFARAAAGRASGALLGFLIGLRVDASLAIPKFLWFRDRLTGFAHVDR